MRAIAFSFLFFLSLLAKSQLGPYLKTMYIPYDGNISDSSIYNNIVFNFGGVLSDDRLGRQNESCYFDGIDDFQRVKPVNKNIDFSKLDNFTISLWMKADSIKSGGMPLLSKRKLGGGIAPRGYSLNLDSSGMVYFEIRDASNNVTVLNSGINVSDGDWHFVAVQRSIPKDSIWFFIDGAFENAVIDNSVSGLTHDSTLLIGRDMYSGEYFNGKVDEIRIYKKVLSACELYELLRAGEFNQYDTVFVCRNEPYQFKDGSGTSSIKSDTSYFYSFKSKNGCDSIVARELIKVNRLHNIIYQHGTLIETANLPDLTFQWVECLGPDTMRVIPNETNYYYQPTSNGNYAVILYSDSCIDTTRCFSYQTLSSSNIQTDNSEYNIYPNPNNGQFRIEGVKNQCKIEVYSHEGKLIRQFSKVNSQRELRLPKNLQSGLYFVRIITNQSTVALRLIKNE